ncbi:reticulocyte binding protein 2 (PvRBP-2) [Plasmodium vivax India VII]|uniref:Reticulocyte binding protein 2 (PvRBP-2) n=1 Tax=Plasmodium vivax India VII TaxID=1077284 RepID=A0A0J9SIF2_PLAVI|nr:reticulocyte binding protein 2 (PvRBP-2) [Plasmodium vivax India VII]
MEKNILWVIFYNFLFILLASCKDTHRSKPSRLKHDHNLLPNYVNLMKDDQNGQNSENRGDNINNHNKNHNDQNNHNGNNDNSINSEYLKTSHLQNSSAMVHLNDHKITTKPARYSYIQRSKIYALNPNNKKIENINNELHSVPNSFVQYYVYTNLNATVYKMRYISIFDEYNNIVSLHLPYHARVNYLMEIKNYSVAYRELQSDVYSYYDPQIDKVFKVAEKNAIVCEKYINNLYNTVTRLENPEQFKNNRDNYSKEIKEYQKQLTSLHDCLFENHRQNYKDIIYADTTIFDSLQNMYCYSEDKCLSKLYRDMLGLSMKKINEYEQKKKNEDINKIINIHDTAVDVMRKIKRELKPSFDSDTADFVIGEIKYIIERLKAHSEKIKSASDLVKYINQETVPNEISKNEIKSNYIVLAIHTGSFLFSTEHVKMLEEIFKSKEQILYKICSKFLNDLKNRITTLINSEYSSSNCTPIVSTCEEAKKSLESLRTSSTGKLGNRDLNSKSEIASVKQSYDGKMLKLEEAIKRAEEIINSVNEIVQFNTTETEAKKKETDSIPQNINALEKDKKLLEVIDAIKKQKQKISENSNKIKEFSGAADTLKAEVEELKKGIDEDVNKILKPF